MSLTGILLRGFGPLGPSEVTATEDPLEHSPSNIVRYLLVGFAQGIIPVTINDVWPIYVASEPTSPDNVVTIYDTSGIVEGRLQGSGVVPEHFGFQVRVRAQTHEAGWAKIKQIANCMDTTVNRTVVTVSTNNYVVEAITRRGGIITLGKEPNSSRIVFTLNATVAISQTN